MMMDELRKIAEEFDVTVVITVSPEIKTVAFKRKKAFYVVGDYKVLEPTDRVPDAARIVAEEVAKASEAEE